MIHDEMNGEISLTKTLWFTVLCVIICVISFVICGGWKMDQGGAVVNTGNFKAGLCSKGLDSFHILSISLWSPCNRAVTKGPEWEYIACTAYTFAVLSLRMALSTPVKPETRVFLARFVLPLFCLCPWEFIASNWIMRYSWPQRTPFKEMPCWAQSCDWEVLTLSIASVFPRIQTVQGITGWQPTNGIYLIYDWIIFVPGS